MSLIRALSASFFALGAAAGVSAQQKAAKATTFTIRVENVTTGEALKLSNGKTAPFVIAPVLYAVHTGNTNPLFLGGQVDAGKGLRTLAETGNPEPLSKAIGGQPGVVAVDADARPVGALAGGPLPPGKALRVQRDGRTGPVPLNRLHVRAIERLVLLQRPADRAVRRGEARKRQHVRPDLAVGRGDRSRRGAGARPDQGPRQQDPEAGVREHQAIAHATGKWSYPRNGFKLTITPAGDAMSSK